MRLLWNGEWIEVPAPVAVPGATLLKIKATVPIERVRVPSGRVIRAPYRKAARFAVLDGPSSTVRKVRSKREDARLQGDYRIVAALASATDETEERLALCPRVAPCAELMVCPEDLVFAAPGASTEALQRFAEALRPQAGMLAELCTQSFLYSGQAPPAALRELAATAAKAATTAAGASRSGGGPVLHPLAPEGSFATTLQLGDRGPRDGVSVAVLGAGDYARTQIIPALTRARLRPYAIADREPQIAGEVGRASGFVVATTDARAAIESLPGPGLVVVATAHDSHAALAAAALDAGHRVFAEKPAVITREDLKLLAAAAARTPGRLDLGFNRRHHPLTRRLRTAVAGEQGPLTITCLVREISISPNHWYFWPNQGTRVAGNLCHWLDLGISLLDPATVASEVTVTPAAPNPGHGSNDAERVLAVTFDDGSLLTIVATDRGDDLQGVQETIDVRRGLVTARIDDFRSITVLRNGRSRTVRRLWRDKGHEAMFESCFRRAAADQAAVYPAGDLDRVATVQIAATELIDTGGIKRVLEGDAD